MDDCGRTSLHGTNGLVDRRLSSTGTLRNKIRDDRKWRRLFHVNNMGNNAENHEDCGLVRRSFQWKRCFVDDGCSL